MKAILALDTSSNSTGVALCVDGEVAAASAVVRAYRHAENLFAQVDEVLKRASVSPRELSGIAVTRGPGSFTGLRVGIATAKGLAYGLGLPVAGVSSLRALAAPGMGASEVTAVAIDARKGQVYGSAYLPDGSEVLLEKAWEPKTYAAALAALNKRVLLIGSGAGVYREVFTAGLGENLLVAETSLWEIDPGAVALLGYAEFEAGRVVEAARLVPFYLRRSEAEEKAGVQV